MRLIGRNYDLIGQILKCFEDEGTKSNKKRGSSVKRIADEQEYSKKYRKEMVG